MKKSLLHFCFIICGSLFFLKCTETTKTVKQADAKPEADSSTSVTKHEKKFPENAVVNLYVYAIEEYLGKRPEKFAIDTLFIGSGAEFVPVTLPSTVKNIPIVQLDPVKATRRYHNPSVYLNVVGWPGEKRSEFLIVTFFEGGKPQHNFHILFEGNSLENQVRPDTSWFEYAYTKPKPAK